MNRVLCFLVGIFLGTITLSAQKSDSIIYHIQLDTISHELKVEQEFHLYNHSNRILKEIYLNAWANAYSGRVTQLNLYKLQERKGNLHFSQKDERGGLKKLDLFNDLGDSLSYEIQEREFLKINLGNLWKKNEQLILKANYTVKLPFDAVTRYGYNKEGDYLLKYFLLQAAVLDQNSNWVLQHFKDFESLAAYPSTHIVHFDVPSNYHLLSDLEWKNGVGQASNLAHFRIYLTKNTQKFRQYLTNEFEVDFGFQSDSIDVPIIDSLLPKQLKFLENHLGELPSNKLFISSRTKKDQNYVGVDDVDIWIKKIKIFSPEQRNALKLFQLISYEYIDRLFTVNKIQDHWLKNGLQYYLMMKYVDTQFPDLKLAGNLPEDVKILGMKPLKFFHAAKLGMNDRYKLLYLYLARQNYDQAINTPFDELSNMNQVAISGFKSALSFYYIDQYLGNGYFDVLLKDFFSKNSGRLISQLDFQNYLVEHSRKDLSWFFDDYIDKKDKINFKLVSISKTKEDFNVKIKNSTRFRGPFQLVAYKNGIPMTKRWYVSPAKNTTVSFPNGDYDKIQLNPGYLFPEFNDRDNTLRTKGLFKNSKKIQLKLFADIEDPEYSQIFLKPQIQWNNYDKFQLGIRFHNQSPLTRPFKWNLTPRYSTGTGSLTGSAGVQNTFTPRTTVFRSITIGGSSKYEHYDRDLSFLKWSLYSDFSFKKDPRASLSQGFVFSYDNLNKEVPALQIQTDEDKYGLFNFTYYYSRPDYIHESHGSLSLQTTDVFTKVFAEFYYRWRFSSKKQLGARLFIGSFVKNQSNTDYFNFGVSKVSDYAFSLNMLGRSESSGVLSQQYFLAETGMKTMYDFTVNQWVIGGNFEWPIWKMFDLYADAAVYKNKFQGAEFIYDSGIRLQFIPDFLELYFPIQSSLGFEPAKDKYWEKIRFTLNLNLSKVIRHLRRGWY